jgi:hypothetical protein
LILDAMSNLSMEQGDAAYAHHDLPGAAAAYRNALTLTSRLPAVAGTTQDKTADARKRLARAESALAPAAQRQAR